MKTVILDVRSPEQAMTEIGATLRTGRPLPGAALGLVLGTPRQHLQSETGAADTAVP